MNVMLSAELERFVSMKVESGAYPSASEVIRDGLRLLQLREERDDSEIADLRAAIAVGIEQADSGGLKPFDENAVARIQARGRRQLGDEPAVDSP